MVRETGCGERFDAAFSLCCGGLIVLGMFYPGCSAAAFGLQLAYALRFVLRGQAERVFGQLFFILPYAGVFKLTPGSSSLLTYLELLIAVMLLLRYREIPGRFLGAWLGFASFVLWSGGADIGEAVKQIAVPLLVLCFFRYARCAFRPVVLSLVRGLLTSSLAGFLCGGMPELEAYMSRSVAYESGADVVRFSGLYNDPNYYSVIMMLAFVCLLILCMNGRMRLSALALCACIALFGIRTVSKSFLLMLGGVSLGGGCLLFVRGRCREGLLLLGTAAVTAALVMTGRTALLDDVLARLRYGSGSAAGLTTGRTELWLNYLNVFAAQPAKLLTGFGICGVLPGGMYPHNTALDFLYFYGVTGTVVFFLSVGFACGKCRVCRRAENWLPLGCMAVMMMFISSLLSFDFAFILMLVLHALNRETGGRGERAVESVA